MPPEVGEQPPTAEETPRTPTPALNEPIPG
jgi:hypothetical protein